MPYREIDPPKYTYITFDPRRHSFSPKHQAELDKINQRLCPACSDGWLISKPTPEHSTRFVCSNVGCRKIFVPENQTAPIKQNNT